MKTHWERARPERRVSVKGNLTQACGRDARAPSDFRLKVILDIPWKEEYCRCRVKGVYGKFSAAVLR
jgi:hypothetical protein